MRRRADESAVTTTGVAPHRGLAPASNWLEDLPCYLTEVDEPASPLRHRCSAPARRGWKSDRTASSTPAPPPHNPFAMTYGIWGTTAEPMLVISRVIDIAPDRIEALLQAWWHAQRPEVAVAEVTVDVHDDRVTLGAPVHDGVTACLCHLSADLKPSWRLRALHLQLDVLPWSSWQSELDLRPRRATRPTPRYFRMGHGLLDVIVRGVRQIPGAQAGWMAAPGPAVRGETSAPL